MVGEAWSVIMGSGSKFSDQNNPHVMVQAGASGSTGILEITDMIFKTAGPGKLKGSYSLIIAYLNIS